MSTVLLFDAARKLSFLEWELQHRQLIYNDHELRIIEAIRDDYRVLVEADQGIRCKAVGLRSVA
jgi:hypothetical protein